MKWVLLPVIAGVLAIAQAQPSPSTKMHDVTGSTYEHLATAIIELRQTEDNLVKGILMHHLALASEHLQQAQNAAAAERPAHFESAALEVANLANEGDKRVQAVRQRLLKAGHHHHTDTETKEDYIFIDSKEKKGLLDLAGKVGKMDAATSADDVKAAASGLASLAGKALAEK